MNATNRLATEHIRLMSQLEAATAVGDVSLAAIVTSNLRAIEAQMMAIDAAESANRAIFGAEE